MSKEKSLGWALALWLILGIVGGHRFYLNKPVSGAIMFLTAGGFLLWWVIDGFRLGDMVYRHNKELENDGT